MKSKLPIIFVFTGILIILTSFLPIPIPGVNIHDTYFVIAVTGVTSIFLLINLMFALIYHIFGKRLKTKIGLAHYVIMTISIFAFRFSTLIESDNPLICFEDSLRANFQCHLHQITIGLFLSSLVIFLINVVVGIMRKMAST